MENPEEQFKINPEAAVERRGVESRDLNPEEREALRGVLDEVLGRKD